MSPLSANRYTSPPRQHDELGLLDVDGSIGVVVQAVGRLAGVALGLGGGRVFTQEDLLQPHHRGLEGQGRDVGRHVGHHQDPQEEQHLQWEASMSSPSLASPSFSSSSSSSSSSCLAQKVVAATEHGTGELERVCVALF